MGGPLGALTVERLDLMLRLYLPLNLKRGRLTGDRAGRLCRARSRGIGATSCASSRARSRPGTTYLREVEANLPRLAGIPALIIWPDSDPGFGDAELARWQTLYPAAEVVHLQRTGQYIDEDAPADVAAAVRVWWSRQAGAHAPAAGTGPS